MNLVKKILKEAYELGENEFIDLEGEDVVPIIKQVFNSVYPGIKLYFEIEDYIYVSTNKHPQQLTQYRGGRLKDTKEEEFFLAMGGYLSNEESETVLTLTMENANSGKYVGVVTKIIQSLLKSQSLKYSISKNCLLIKHDASGGVWKHIASKLGMEYIDDRNY